MTKIQLSDTAYSSRLCPCNSNCLSQSGAWPLPLHVSPSGERYLTRKTDLLLRGRRAGNILYRSTVFWTPSDLKLCGIRQGTSLLMSHLGRGFVAMPSNQPRLIVLTLELVQR